MARPNKRTREKRAAALGRHTIPAERVEELARQGTLNALVEGRLSSTSDVRITAGNAITFNFSGGTK